MGRMSYKAGHCARAIKAGHKVKREHEARPKLHGSESNVHPVSPKASSFSSFPSVYF